MSASEHSNEIYSASMKGELLNFPKPPIDSVATGIGKQVKWLWVLTLVVSTMCGIAYLMNELTGIILAMVLLPSLGLLTVIFQVWMHLQNRKLKKLASGKYYVNWSIADEPWEHVCTERKKMNSRIPGMFAKWFGASTLFAMAGYYFIENKTFFGSAVLHFVLPTFVVTAISFLIGQLCIVFAGMTDHIMRTQPPRVLIGPAGIYMTGLFSPNVTMEQKLVSAEVNETEHLLKCKYRIAQRQGLEFRVVNYPFPSDELAAAHCVADLLIDPPGDE